MKNNLTISLILLTLVFAFALACRVSPPPELAIEEVAKLEFKMIDPINYYFEGRDDLIVEITKGEADRVELLLSTDNGSSYEKYPLEKDGDTFFLRSEFEPLRTYWYVAATGLGATTTYGSFQEPNIIEKYISMGNTNVIVGNKMRELLSKGDISVYKENHPLSVQGSDVTMDHYIEILNPGQQHSSYVIQYSTELTDNGIPLLTEPENIAPFKLQTDAFSSIGYILIYSTNQNFLEELLRRPQFFPVKHDRPPYVYKN